MKTLLTLLVLPLIILAALVMLFIPQEEMDAHHAGL